MLGSTSGGARQSGLTVEQRTRIENNARQSGLTVEQRTRIENNRRTALERRRSGGAGRGVAPVSLHVRTILETVPGFQFPPSRDGVDSALPCAQFPRDNDLSDGVQFGRDFEEDSEDDDDVYDVGVGRDEALGGRDEAVAKQGSECAVANSNLRQSVLILRKPSSKLSGRHSRMLISSVVYFISSKLFAGT